MEEKEEPLENVVISLADCISPQSTTFSEVLKCNANVFRTEQNKPSCFSRS